MLLSCQMTIINFAEFLQDELDTRGWKASDLVKRSKLSPAIISRALNSERLPSPESLSAIASALGYPPERLFRIAGILPPKPEIDEITEKLIHLVAQMNELERADVHEYAALVLRRRSQRDLLAELKIKLDEVQPGQAEDVLKLLTEFLSKAGARRLK